MRGYELTNTGENVLQKCGLEIKPGERGWDWEERLTQFDFSTIEDLVDRQAAIQEVTRILAQRKASRSGEQIDEEGINSRVQQIMDAVQSL